MKNYPRLTPFFLLHPQFLNDMMQHKSRVLTRSGMIRCTTAIEQMGEQRKWGGTATCIVNAVEPIGDFKPLKELFYFHPMGSEYQGFRVYFAEESPKPLLLQMSLVPLQRDLEQRDLQEVLDALSRYRNYWK